ncbi:nitrate- and nitrite sensing domain-containing protein [Streptomyces sp. NPDC002917]|uniref:nitrate- and nitrite sensing domain-containing protein n=1 Tax=unclassified Streptomyces TaxID=2593676 RepID=UPI0033AB71BB|nr:nitrate- and nitrite sensing domain-containing protein [Streptomyces sp. NBC_01653]WTD36019.1 nitrate- and nitrite sensing domain-containing protein [Streptomyces sp. NBC_01643]WTD91434.1 nitrate- and nitrite sensing domain-containing protein [Streptomyces sp. NBC_01637]
MQGRFKRDGSAAAEQEPHGGTDRGSSPQHAQNPGPATAGDAGERSPRSAVTASSTADPITPLQPRGAVNTGSRIALRNWRISTRLVSLLALPVVAATTLGGLRISDSMNDIQQLDHMQLLTQMTKQATTLAQALQEERDRSAGPLANGVKSDVAKIAEPRKRTDRAKAAFFDATTEIGNTDDDEALEGIHASVQQIASQLGQIRDIRKEAYAKGSPSLQTVDAYSQLITSLLSLSQDMAQATSNPEMIKRTRALAAFSSAKEYASVQRAIIAAALPGGGGQKGSHLDQNDRQFGRAALHKETLALKSFAVTYTATGQNAEELTATLENGNPEIKAADTYAQKVLDSPTGMAGTAPRSYLDWYDQSSTKIQAMKTIEETLLSDMEGKARELRDQSQREAIISGVLILLVLGVSLVGAFVVARSMIRSLRRLQDTATRVAQDRLPELVKQLSEADPQDVDTSVESVGVHSRDEIGKVAAAFDDVHREAVRLAAEQALLRGNVNAMFTNLSRRSQGLIQRQLSLISELESREADPDQLSSLFKLDHLATRMRRNGENLLVLAGEEPGRRWTRPVPLVDVLRAAASEVEQYERIELAAVPATEVAGRVVNDLVHLLAELLENATSFSSPQTKVRVTGHALPDGRVLVEIHDTGIGLSPEDLAAINERLASPPTVDVSVSRRMGLFVVGRLSLRHGIRIQLRPSDSGGTTALVMLPVDVAHGGKQPAPKPAAGQQRAGGNGAVAGNGNGNRPGLGAAAGAQRGQVGAGSGPRAALPARDGGGPRQPQNQQGQPNQQGQQPNQQRQPNSGFQSAGLSGTGPQDFARQEPPRQGGGLSGAFGGGARPGAPGGQGDPGRTEQGQSNLFGQTRPGQYDQPGQPGHQNGPAGRQAPQPQQARHNAPDNQGGFQQSGGPGNPGRQLPPVGGPRAELPGGNPQPQRPQATSWGTENPSVPQRSPLDAPRGHEEPESTGQFQRPMNPAMGQRPPLDNRQGPGSTAEFARPDFSAPAPQAHLPQHQDPAGTAQFARPDFGRPQPSQDQGLPAPRPRGRDNEDFRAPRPATAPAGEAQYRPVLPPQPQPEALPPAGPGDGRTPLYDTLETNWFHGPQQGGQQPPAGPQAPSVPQQTPQDRPAAPMPRRGAGDTGATTSTWRTSPNDELVRQAERAKKPAAGGITTSGLPRRVPRANLVPGTAQQQSHQSGPQVSRAPDDVRGRLTNLRRGIQQGRQANNGSSTGSFPLGPTHQQER